MSWKLVARFRPINCFLLSLFLWTPGWQTSAAYWLTRFMWKEILFTLPRESIMKKLRAVLEKYNIEDSHVLEIFAKISPDHLILLSMFLWTPGWQTSAANWRTRFRWKEILFTWRSESIMKKFRAVLEKCNIKDSLLMHVLVYILLWTTVCCYRCFHERQSYKRARPIGWLGSN